MSRIAVPALAALVALSVTTVALGQESKTMAPASAPSPDEQAVRQVTQDFVKAFNADSAEKAAALFLVGAESVCLEGNPKR